MGDEPYTQYSEVEQFDDAENATTAHLDVSQEQGWIAIPYKEFPQDWNHVSDIQSLRALDRSFLFPGKLFTTLYMNHLWIIIMH